MTSTTETAQGPQPPRLPGVDTADAAPRRVGDRVFSGLSRGSGVLLLVIMASIAIFLVWQAREALSANTANFFTERTWFPDDAAKPVFGVAALVVGTVISSVLAMAMAVPVAVGVALFISHYAPRRLARALAYVIDLLAAVPSVVYGLWGVFFIIPRIEGLHRWLDHWLGWIPLFDRTQVGARSIFTASVILAIMILPVVAAVSREVFFQSPRILEEAALALGATRWEMIRMSVLPFGRSGVISAAMLGLGRALGETVAVAMVLSSNFLISIKVLNPGGNTIAANIANKFGEAGPTGRGALIASGLVLFVITLVVNGAARLIIARRREYSAAAA